jgi:biotin-dependent carboxylase-like uncharacterized protein
VIEIVEPGPLATVQDRGRTGYAALGVARSGAFDRAAMRLANRLVGNPEDRAVIETTLGGLHIKLHASATVALTGAVCPGAPGWDVPITLGAGSMIRLGVPARGLRSYLAIRGGVDVDPVLGSRSTDTLSGIGPSQLRAGDQLRIGTPSAPLVDASAGSPESSAVLRVRMGPRDDWFTVRARATFLVAEWTVRPESDRVGIRLDGPALDRSRADELATEPTLPGAVQVPPDGRPIVFGPDAPVTGGYPVIAVLTNLDPAAQLRPGDLVRFRSGSGPRS